MNVVVDASALLAAILGEPGADAVLPYIGLGVVSTVNLTEVFSRLYDGGISESDAGHMIDRFAFAIAPFDKAQAADAARLRIETRQMGLSLGDRACIALALALNLPVLTADRQWEKLEIGVDIRLIR